jgi:hypothetical protein
MTPTRWLLTIVSFAATIGVSLYMISGWSQQGASLLLPARAHLLAFSAVVVEVLARSLKLRRRRQASVSRSSPRFAPVRRNFAAAITGAFRRRARRGSSRLHESGPPRQNVLVILYADSF